MKKMNRSVRSLCLAAMIAALYLALTLLFQPISFGAVQFRISEAMTLLPAIFPEATIGLTLGCFLSNFLAGANVYDVVFGTLATLLAALISWRVGKKKLWYAAGADSYHPEDDYPQGLFPGQTDHHCNANAGQHDQKSSTHPGRSH